VTNFGLSQNSVVQILAKHGPTTTSRVAAMLREAGVSSAAARQRVSRLPEVVRTLHRMPFPKRSRFIYLESQFGTDVYWSSLLRELEAANPAYATALAGIKSRGGVVSRAQFDISSGSPLRQKGQLASSLVLSRLLAADLVISTTIEGVGECISLSDDAILGTPQLATFRARLLTEAVLLDAIRSWAVRMNMGSPNTMKIRGEEPFPQFSTFRFDLVGPCYLRPLVRYRENKLDPGFVVADVITGETLDERLIRPFLRKCLLLNNLRGIRPYLPMLIADGFTPEALQICRSRGIISTRPESLFGKDVARALADLLQTLSNSAVIANHNPSQIETLFRRLSGVEGSAGNLRGALFELVVGHMVRSLEGGNVDIGVLVHDVETGRRAEVDVRRIKEREVVIYECKGRQPSSLTQSLEVEDWLSKKVATIHKAARQERRFDGCNLRFEFWTSGGFDPDALQTLRHARANTRKYEIGWKDGDAIRQYARKINTPGPLKILNEHYFNHPLSNLGFNDGTPQELQEEELELI
jgi:hypothetical protein